MIRPLVSIVITNHNYGAFLRHAVDSALAQGHPRVQVIAVDDGSQDESRAILRSYGARITTLEVDHLGQSGALNAGIERAAGDIVCPLDADDAFLPNKARVVARELEADLAGGDSVLLCNPMQPIDARGSRLAGRDPADLPLNLEGNLYEFARRHRYLPFAGAPMSGLALTRRLVDDLFPLRTTTGVLHGADDLIVRGASLIGSVRWIEEELTLYRHHGPNAFGRGRGRSHAFHVNQDAFLNERLALAGREPLIDFFSSEYARPFYLQEHRRRDMAALAWQVLRRDPGRESAAFALRTMLTAIWFGAAPRSERERARSARQQRAEAEG